MFGVGAGVGVTPRKVGAWLVCLLCTVHVLIVGLTTMLPPDSVLLRAIYPRVEPYLLATGSEQIWAMFTGAPHYHRFRVHLKGIDENGDLWLLGPVTPGLEPYDETTVRHHKLLSTLGLPEFGHYRDAYLETARREFEARQEVRLRSLTLEMEVHRLRYLHDIRRLRQVSYDDSYVAGSRMWSD